MTQLSLRSVEAFDDARFFEFAREDGGAHRIGMSPLDDPTAIIANHRALGFTFDARDAMTINSRGNEITGAQRRAAYRARLPEST